MLKARPFVLPNTKGFTLIELLVAIALLAITLAFAVPSLYTFYLDWKMEAAVDALQASLNYARATSLEKNVTTVVCPYNGSSAICGTNWSLGWAVIKNNSDGTSTLIKTDQLDSSTMSILTNGISQVTFDARGVANAQTNFTICDSRGNARAGSLMVMPSGYIQSDNQLGIAVWNGASLACN